MSDGVVGLGLQNSRDTRSDTIGSDDELGSHIDHLSVGSADARTAHATVGSPEDVHDGAAVNDLGAGSQRGVDEYGVQDCPTRSIQPVYAVPLFDGLDS